MTVGIFNRVRTSVWAGMLALALVSAPAFAQKRSDKEKKLKQLAYQQQKKKAVEAEQKAKLEDKKNQKKPFRLSIAAKKKSKTATTATTGVSAPAAKAPISKKADQGIKPIEIKKQQPPTAYTVGVNPSRREQRRMEAETKREESQQKSATTAALERPGWSAQNARYSKLMSAASRSNKQGEKVSGSVFAYLSERLRVADPSIYILNLRLANQLKEGFDGAGVPLFSEDGSVDPQVREKVIADYYSPQDFEVLRQLMTGLKKETYNNPALIGPAGVGKSHTINELILALSLGIYPEKLAQRLRFAKDGETIAEPKTNNEHFQAAYVGRTQFVAINQKLLSLDNTMEGKAFADAGTRQASILLDLFETAKKEFRETGVRTVFLFEEIGNLPKELLDIMKSPLDETGFTDPFDAVKKGREAGWSMLAMTTPDEFKNKVIQKDAASARRYYRIDMPERTERDALEILKSKVPAWERRYGVKLPEEVLNYVIYARKLYNTAGAALPAAPIGFIDELLADRADATSPEVTIDEAYAAMVRKAHLPEDIWLPKDGQAPFADCEAKMQERVIGHTAIIRKICQRLETAATNMFRDFPVFIFGGPSGSGKDTIVAALNEVVFGHDGKHLNFSVAGMDNAALSRVLRSSPDQEAEILSRLGNGKSLNGAIVLNEAKDLSSPAFGQMKVLVETSMIDETPLNLNILFILGQYFEELFMKDGELRGKTPEEVQAWIDAQDDEELMRVFSEGRDNKRFGAMDPALVLRALRTGGIFVIPPMPVSQYHELVKLEVKKSVQDLQNRAATTVLVTPRLVDWMSELAEQSGIGSRQISGFVRDFVETSIAMAKRQGVQQFGQTLEIDGDPSTREVTVRNERVPAQKAVLKPSEYVRTRNCAKALGGY